VSLFTPELLDKINQLVVDAGHILLKKKTTKCCVGGAIPLWLVCHERKRKLAVLY